MQQVLKSVKISNLFNFEKHKKILNYYQLNKCLINYYSMNTLIFMFILKYI